MALRFFLDQNVQAPVARTLRQMGHECWTADDAGVGRLVDDQLTVYAQEKAAALVTHDREFSQRRRRNVVGRHIFLRCDEWEAAKLVEAYLPGVEQLLEFKDDVWIEISKDGFKLDFSWK